MLREISSDYVVVDWGTSNLRVWSIEQGRVVDKRSTSQGVLFMQGKSFSSVLKNLLDDMAINWQSLNKIYVVGMAGSNIGWKNTAYLQCPVDLGSLGNFLNPVDTTRGVDIVIVPGVCINQQDRQDVMRGEETQMVWTAVHHSHGIVILPGTHSKWARIQDRQLQTFYTCMTGELFSVLSQYSVLGRTVAEQVSESMWFEAGVALGLQKGGLDTKLFSVRAGSVLGKIAENGVLDYLSGLLIGSEINVMRNLLLSGNTYPVTVIGEEKLSQRYSKALTLADITHEQLSAEEALLKGVRFIHEQAI